MNHEILFFQCTTDPLLNQDRGHSLQISSLVSRQSALFPLKVHWI